MKRLRTLLVDSNRHVQKAMRSFLVTRPEIEFVGWAASGEEALRETVRQAPDLVLIDVDMPDMNAFETASRMRKLDHAVRIIMVALFDDCAYRARAKACGVLAVIPKLEVMDRLPELLAQLKAGQEDDSTTAAQYRALARQAARAG